MIKVNKLLSFFRRGIFLRKLKHVLRAFIEA